VQYIQPGEEKVMSLFQEGYASVPVWSETLADRFTPVTLFDAFRDRKPVILLESAERGEIWGRYSLLIFDVDEEIRYRGFFNWLGKLEDRFPVEKVYPEPHVPFLGGAVGFLSYEAVKTWEKIPPNLESEYPIAYFVSAPRFLYFDHLRHTMGAVYLVGENDERGYRKAREWIAGIFATMESYSGKKEKVSFRLTGPVSSNFSQHEFQKAVEQVRCLIEDGHASQVVLSRRFSATFQGDPFESYRELRSLNPSPYLFYLDAGDFQLAGSSPEMLIKLQGGVLRTRPIAGTRKRRDDATDAEIVADLMGDEKENAEHVMLLDLGRNDLGRVCRPGTVEVEEFMKVERYSHVYHIVSSVRGLLRDGITPWKALQACFPAGTVSGAPKVRAMQIIEEMEPSPRGPYAGALGYVSRNGSVDTAIVIRTLFFSNGTASVQAGAGIVHDSIPESEFQETANKAEALLTALRNAERS